MSSATKEYDIGEEISYTYTNDPNNIVMFMHYGFIIPNNIFNLFELKLRDRTEFSPQ